MIISILISFLVGVASGFTAQMAADRLKPSEPSAPIVICIAQTKGEKPDCQRAEIK